ncbi:MAG: rod shape-determining protein MreC [Clostridia bacterium]|nr:rod shape-determining protein MreC [Clostridia bacterium]
MRFFFKSRQFKIIVAVVAAVLVLTATFAIIGNRMAPQTDIIGSVTQPFRSLAARINEAINDIKTSYSGGNALMMENAELTAEIDELRKKLADYDEMAAQNEDYKKYLNIKDVHPDFSFASANLIARDSDDIYRGFTINKGSLSGISRYDPVITDSGIVGYITEVGLTSSKVTTILNPQITLGAIDKRSGDSGIITGSLDLAKDGKCILKNLARSSSVAVGDYISTSGEGIFPGDLLIGSIEYIGTDSINSSIYAEIKPFVKIDEIRSVMVITSFEGQLSESKGN